MQPIRICELIVIWLFSMVVVRYSVIVVWFQSVGDCDTFVIVAY